jgi:hypothetical protein
MLAAGKSLSLVPVPRNEPDNQEKINCKNRTKINGRKN